MQIRLQLLPSATSTLRTTSILAFHRPIISLRRSRRNNFRTFSVTSKLLPCILFDRYSLSLRSRPRQARSALRSGSATSALLMVLGPLTKSFWSSRRRWTMLVAWYLHCIHFQCTLTLTRILPPEIPVDEVWLRPVAHDTARDRRRCR